MWVSVAILCGTSAVLLTCLTIALCAPGGDCADAGSVSGQPVSLARRPSWLHVSWPLILVVARWVTPLMTWGLRQRVQHRMNRASLTDWTPPQFVAFQFLLGLLGGAVTAVLVVTREGERLQSVWPMCGILLVASLTAFWPILWLRGRRRQSVASITRQLPFFLDMVTMGLDCGLNMQSSVQLALEYLPQGPLKAAWARALLDMRAGAPRADALREMAVTIDLAVMRQLVAALIQGESMGLSLARIIGEYARQQRTQRMMAAEKLALQAPVKMLFPLALCIFPCTFLVLGFPVAVQLFGLAP